MTISAVGTILQPASTLNSGNFTFPLTPTTIGNIILFRVNVLADTLVISGMTSSNMVFTKVVPELKTAPVSGAISIWMGVATGTGLATVTATHSAGTSTQALVKAQEFSSSYGNNQTWVIDGPGGSTLQASSTTITWPTLTPSDARARLYFGITIVQQVSTVGTTSGFTYQTDAGGNQLIYNLSVTAASTPTETQSPAGQAGNQCCLVFDNPYPQPPLRPIARRIRATTR